MSMLEGQPVPAAQEIAITDNLDDLLAALPEQVAAQTRAAISERLDDGLIEIVLDLGRRPKARFQHGSVYLTEEETNRADLARVAERIGRFGEDNRAGIERTLHRISAIRNRCGDIVEYCTVIEQSELKAAEQLLRDNGYTVIPPLTFEDVTPIMEALEEGTEYWVVSLSNPEGVIALRYTGRNLYEQLVIKRGMVYLNKEHALIAARHMFGLKGGEL